MQFTAQQISQLLQGTVEGDSSVTVSSLSKIEEGKTGSLSFLANPKYTPYIYTTKASVVIVNKDFVPDQPVQSTLIRVSDAYQAFARLLEMVNEHIENKTGTEQPVFISSTAKVGKNVYLGAFAYVGNNAKIGNNVKIYPQVFIGDEVEVGDNTVIKAGVKIYALSKIGSHCLIHAGAVIGSDGFGFAPGETKYSKIPQTGNVIIEDYVEVGANTAIDRATLGSTIIRKGAKLDNLIQIAHNVEIGENTAIAGLSAIAGSTKIGKNVMIGGQAGVIGHLTIADGVKIAGQSGVGKSITKPGEIVEGTPAFNISEFKRVYVIFKKLPELENRIRELEKLLGEYKVNSSDDNSSDDLKSSDE